MPFWKRRKVIYNWDDNFVPTTESGLNRDYEREWFWTCPENIFIHLTAITISLVIGAGIRSSQLEYALYSSQEKYFKFQLTKDLTSNTNYVWYLITSGVFQPTSPPTYAMVNWLPHNLRMIPGDRISFRVGGDFFAGDHFTYYKLRYNRYDLT